MLYRWLCTKGYEVIVEQQIAHELQLKNVKTGTLAEIGQLADLAVVVGARRARSPVTILKLLESTVATWVS
jgi:hypothetical protein